MTNICYANRIVGILGNKNIKTQCYLKKNMRKDI